MEEGMPQLLILTLALVGASVFVLFVGGFVRAHRGINAFLEARRIRNSGGPATPRQTRQYGELCARARKACGLTWDPSAPGLARIAALPSKWQFLAANVTGDEAPEDLELYADLVAVFVWSHPRDTSETQFDNQVFLTMARVIAQRERNRALARGLRKDAALDLGVEAGKRIVRHFREVSPERFEALTKTAGDTVAKLR
jgi:hypothetical protein